MPTRGLNLGERISAVEARLAAMDDYSHERWHKLANDLQPLILLDRTIRLSITEALAPVTADVAALKRDVEALKLARQQMTGVRKFGEWIIQTAISALVAVAAILALGKHP